MIIDLEYSKEPTAILLKATMDFNNVNKKANYKMKIKHQYIFCIQAVVK